MGERWGEAGKKIEKRENDAKILKGGELGPRAVKGKQTPHKKYESLEEGKIKKKARE